MDKKITIRDVAREAGVSIATVSYVLNNRFDQKISANTRKKVLQIANLLQFTPSYAAKLLTTGKSHNIGILSGNFSFFDFFHIRFIKDLISVFADKGYKTTILPYPNAARSNNRTSTESSASTSRRSNFCN